jgi:SagB-type dehydrogenase family enzyme
MKNKFNLKRLFNLPVTLAEKFHEKTKIKGYFDPHEYNPRTWEKIYYKAYARLDETVLLKPNLKKNILKEALDGRKSSRKFSGRPLTISNISNLLYYSAGIKNTKDYRFPNRFYPSAGARYPLEIYVLSLKGELEKCLYHYYLKNHSLEKLLALDLFDYERYFNQSWISRASCLILLTAMFKRTTIKYGDRGYRYILIEAGHLGQNIYLVSSALGIGCCAVGGYIDNRLNQLLNIDGIDEAVVYALAVG